MRKAATVRSLLAAAPTIGTHRLARQALQSSVRPVHNLPPSTPPSPSLGTQRQLPRPSLLASQSPSVLGNASKVSASLSPLQLPLFASLSPLQLPLFASPTPLQQPLFPQPANSERLRPTLHSFYTSQFADWLTTTVQTLIQTCTRSKAGYVVMQHWRRRREYHTIFNDRLAVIATLSTSHLGKLREAQPPSTV